MTFLSFTSTTAPSLIRTIATTALSITTRSTSTTTMTLTKPCMYHIPVCPFSDRLKILLELKGVDPSDKAIDFATVDITVPRDPELLKKTRGTTSMPVFENTDGAILKESLVILRYLDETVVAEKPIRRTDPLEHAVENMLIAKEGSFTMAGYKFVMNTDLDKRKDHEENMLKLYRDLNDFLLHHGTKEGPFLFDQFGLAETVFTPFFKRFWFLEYYENFDLPAGDEYDRVREWRTACMEHPATMQASFDEIIKLYYDYAVGHGNGAMPPGRSVSSFVLEPSWKDRPMPPKDKYNHKATDKELGLVG